VSTLNFELNIEVGEEQVDVTLQIPFEEGRPSDDFRRRAGLAPGDDSLVPCI
jgi:hypothetical protein